MPGHSLVGSPKHDLFQSLFGASWLRQVSVEPHESMDLIVTCRPTRTGQFAGNASFGTNSGLPAVEVWMKRFRLGRDPERS